MSWTILDGYIDSEGVETHICHDAFSHNAYNRLLEETITKTPPHEFIFNKLLTLKVMEDEKISEEFIAFQETYFKDMNGKKAILI